MRRPDKEKTKKVLLIAAAAVAAAFPAGMTFAGAHDDQTLHWTLVATVQPGQADAVVPLVTKMAETNRANEPGTLVYEYMQADETIHIYERYSDSAAALEHLGNFGANFAADFLTVFAIESISIYGPAGDDLKAALEGLPVTYMEKIAGFAR